ncbi:MAG: hypothetical protein GY832_40585 [Chloroflexi bacterium]|nr:hypothetical protein [Chloroflexota bacterium]
MHRKSKGMMDFAYTTGAYTIGLLTVMVGAIVCYTLAIFGKIAEADAAVVLTIAATVGFALSTTGVTLRAHRLGRDTTGPLIFGTGLLVAMGGSLAVYTLTLYGMVSETGATLAFASIVVLSLVLVITGVVRRALRPVRSEYRAYSIERKDSGLAVMQPLRRALRPVRSEYRVHTRKVEEGQDGQNG